MLRSLMFAALLAPSVLLGQNEALVHLEEARRAYGADDLVLALTHADSAIAIDAAIPGGYKLRGDIKQRQANLHGALVDYTKAEKLDNNDPRLYISRSAVYISEGRMKEALRDTDKAIKLDPTDADAWYNRACVNYLGQNNDAALKDLERSLKHRPQNADALFLRGVVKGELFDEQEGLEDIEAAIAMKPDIGGGLMSAAVLLFELERYDDAIQRFGEVIAAKDDDLLDALYYRADCYYNVGDKENACADWRRAGEMSDKDAQFIVRNYCLTDFDKIPKKPVKKPRKTVIEF